MQRDALQAGATQNGNARVAQRKLRARAWGSRTRAAQRARAASPRRLRWGQQQSYAYTLDAAGKRTRIEESDGTIRQYGYDSIDRLTSETVTGSLSYSNAFGYDSVGNRLTQTSTGNHPGTVDYTYDNRDRLTLEGTTAYTYDANGNLTAKTGEATYTWDFENRLTRVALSDGSMVDHAYDVDGNRVQTTVTPSGGGTPTVTKYLVDTTGSLSQVIAELDGTGALTSLYVRADNELLSVLRPSGQSSWATRFVHVDGLGSVRVLTDEAGLVTDTRDYEAFGVSNETAGSDSLAYGFAGEPFDGLSQLAYHRARWMDPTGGRFLGMDTHEGHRLVPITLQKYLYAGLSPVNRLDPSGLDFDLGSISAGIVGIGILATMATADSPFRAFQRGRVTNINLDFYVDFMLLRVEPANGLEYPIAATSGKGEGMNNSDMEREPNIGPIPRGRYHIDTTQISDPNIFIDIARNMVRGDWGDWRVPIFADSGTNTHGRSGFFLHGGLFLGSAGCIDIGGGLFGDASTARLLRDLQADPDHLVPLSTH